MGFSASRAVPFSPLPEFRPPWFKFVLSSGAQSLAIALLLWAQVLQTHIIDPPEHTYRMIGLVSTPVPVNHQPQPVRILQKTPVVQVDPPPEALRLPAPQPKPKAQNVAATAPDVKIAARKLEPIPLPPGPVIPRQLVRTNVFSTGSSATPTIARAPQQVQTGGFGDPNGVPARDTGGKPINIAQLGSFDLPSGPGYGNGTGGAKGVRGVVPSSGFGNGIATGDNSGRISASRGNGVVRQAGFTDADPPAPATTRSRPAEAAAPKIVPAEILSKPTPIYTEEARRLRIEGEVLLEVVLGANGRLHVVRVVRGLGHGLDDEAMREAEQIRFKPALRDGQPADSTVVLHFVFQLA